MTLTRILAAVAAAAITIAIAGCTAATPSHTPATHSAVGAASGDQNPVTTSPPAPAGETVSSVSIPSIGVNAPTEQLSRDESGALMPPTSFTDTGWYKDGVLPGQVGPAVIAGHIDSTGAPAVFAHLNALQKGATVAVTLSTGQVVDFVVDHSIQVPKGAFPTSEVYGPTPDPQLRLITCAGTFNPAIGHYDDNIVVFATLAPARPSHGS